MKNRENYHSIIIIGAGPAGISTALQLQREGTSYLLIGEEIGGCVKNAFLIENLITFPQGISGKKLCEIFTEIIQNYRLNFKQLRVNRIDFLQNLFQIETRYGKFQSSYLVLATGSQPKKLDVAGESEGFKQQKLYYEIKNINSTQKRIAIIGSGDVAFDYALNLVQKGNEVIILVRSSKIRAISRLQNLVGEKNNIKIQLNFPISNISLKNEQIRIFSSSAKHLPYFEVDLIIVAIGRIPNSFLIEKYLKTQKNELFQSRRLFLIGDLVHPQYRQISLSMGDGIKTAMELCKSELIK
ncbi:MAG: NAD(P)/FAD-dependent oxidoreductase [Promethearchaeota archaeon]